jgi:hypothetical protein
MYIFNVELSIAERTSSAIAIKQRTYKQVPLYNAYK